MYPLIKYKNLTSNKVYDFQFFEYIKTIFSDTVDWLLSENDAMELDFELNELIQERFCSNRFVRWLYKNNWDEHYPISETIIQNVMNELAQSFYLKFNANLNAIWLNYKVSYDALNPYHISENITISKTGDTNENTDTDITTKQTMRPYNAEIDYPTTTQNVNGTGVDNKSLISKTENETHTNDKKGSLGGLTASEILQKDNEFRMTNFYNIALSFAIKFLSLDTYGGDKFGKGY